MIIEKDNMQHKAFTVSGDAVLFENVSSDTTLVLETEYENWSAKQDFQITYDELLMWREIQDVESEENKTLWENFCAGLHKRGLSIETVIFDIFAVNSDGKYYYVDLQEEAVAA